MHQGQIEELTYGVNDMLTLYLEVHNGMLAQPWWRSIPIPGLFKAIPFDRYEIQLSEVERVLKKIEEHIACIRHALDDLESTPMQQRLHWLV